MCAQRLTSKTHWLSKFVVEVRRKDGKPYPPQSLYQICCGLQRAPAVTECGDEEVVKSGNRMYPETCRAHLC